MMKQYIQRHCPSCDSGDRVKNGQSENGTQRYHCKGCRRSFQHVYTSTAWKPGIKEQIVTHTLNSSGVRDMSRNLGISKDTVTATLKKSPQRGESRLSSIAAGEGSSRGPSN